MNTKLLREVVAYFKEEPRRLRMEHWTKDVVPDAGDNPPCGTVSCVAGTTCILGGKVERFGNGMIIPSGNRQWDEYAKELLDLNQNQATRLFHTSMTRGKRTKLRWPKKYDDAYRAAKTPADRVKALVSRINHFIKTKGAE